jgi:hypothetical protein
MQRLRNLVHRAARRHYVAPFAAAIAFVVLPGCGKAQTPPAPAAAAAEPSMPAGFSADVVKDSVAQTVPGEWRLDSFTVQAAVNTGTLIEPVMRTRFEARVSLSADTFARDGSDGPVVFVRKVAGAGMTKSLYGLSTSTLQAGAWTTQLELQNADVLQGVGDPLAVIPGRVILRGSAEEASYAKEREAAAAQAEAQKLADARRAAELAAAQHAADAAAQTAKRAQEQADAVAEAQKQSAIDAVQASAKRQQAQLDAEAAAKLAQTKAAADLALLQRQADLAAAQQTALQQRTKYLESLRAALQATDRSERLAAVDTALASTDPTVRTLGYDAAFGSQDTAAHNIALRRLFDQKRQIVFNLFAPSQWQNGFRSPDEVISHVGGMQLDIKQIDETSGRFAGQLLLGPDLRWDTAGSIDGDTVSISARGEGKPLPSFWDPVSMFFVLQLSPDKQLDGFFQLGSGGASYSPVIVRVNLD